MTYNHENAVILGLDRNDLKILKTLSSTCYLISDISLETGIPRTSLYYMLPKLKKRGFLEDFRQNKKTYWRTVSNKVIRESYMNSLQDPEVSIGETTTKNISSNTDVTFYQGNHNVLNVFKDIASLPSKSRFYGIQPEPSIIGAISKNSLQDIIDFNNKINGKKLIVEGIIHERGTDSMIKTLTKKDGEKLLKSFANRSADTAKLPEKFLENTKAEIYLYDNKIAIVNWYEEFAVIIQNKDVSELIHGMFTSTKYLLERYDQNEKIARKLIDFKEN